MKNISLCRLRNWANLVRSCVKISGRNIAQRGRPDKAERQTPYLHWIGVKYCHSLYIGNTISKPHLPTFRQSIIIGETIAPHSPSCSWQEPLQVLQGWPNPLPPWTAVPWTKPKRKGEFSPRFSHIALSRSRRRGLAYRDRLRRSIAAQLRPVKTEPRGTEYKPVNGGCQGGEEEQIPTLGEDSGPLTLQQRKSRIIKSKRCMRHKAIYKQNDRWLCFL